MSAAKLKLMVFGLALAATSPGRALPPDKIIRLPPGEMAYFPAGSGHWEVRSSAPRLVRASLASGGEVLVEALAPGEALLVVENRKVGLMYFWLVRVGGEERPAASLELARLDCSCSRSGADQPPVCLVKNLACLESLRRSLAESDATSAEVWIRYDTGGMQLVLRQLGEKIAAEGFPPIELAFVGANLRLEGKLKDENERFRLLGVLFRWMVGKLIIEDRLQLEKPAETAPPAPAAE